ncbi:MAG: formate dehydrogenase [Gammaproteobacteria bacterium]|nr:formate dehydrogenase [Gammaproteobacteria bacterium]MDH5800402.1 formate dehydrogenase [Gammaproteobacteria bacterium]
MGKRQSSKSATPSTPQSKEQQRRAFLAGMVAVGGATAVSAASARLLGNDNNRKAPVQAKIDPPTSKGYQLTEHVQRYYDSLNE